MMYEGLRRISEAADVVVKSEISSVDSGRSFRDRLLRKADRRDARIRISLPPGCPASSFFQFIVGYSEIKELLFGLL
jgi:hypothetical protein